MFDRVNFEGFKGLSEWCCCYHLRLNLGFLKVCPNDVVIDLRLVVTSVHQVLLIVYVLYCGLLRLIGLYLLAIGLILWALWSTWGFIFSFSRALEMFDCGVAEQFRDNELFCAFLALIALSRNYSTNSALNISEHQEARGDHKISLRFAGCPQYTYHATDCYHK